MVIANNEHVESLLEDWNKNDINNSIKKKLEFDKLIKDLETARDIVKNEIKLYLKERQWTKHFDEETKISISIDNIKREDIDRKKLKLLLSPTQYNSIIKIISYEKLSIMTQDDREKLKKFIRKNV